MTASIPSRLNTTRTGQAALQQARDALDRGERLGDWLDPAFEWDKTAA